MNTRDLVKSFGGAAALAAKLGLPPGEPGARVVRAWCHRGLIPPEWFTRIAAVASAEGRDDITVESLAVFRQRRRQERDEARQSQAA